MSSWISSKITKKPNKETTQVIPVQERSGLYLVVEPKPSKCKRFEGRMRYPRGRSGKTQYISLGAFNEKTNNPKQALKKWTDIIFNKRLISPKAVYGYFCCGRKKNSIFLFDHKSHKKITQFNFKSGYLKNKNYIR